MRLRLQIKCAHNEKTNVSAVREWPPDARDRRAGDRVILDRQQSRLGLGRPARGRFELKTAKPTSQEIRCLARRARRRAASKRARPMFPPLPAALR